MISLESAGKPLVWLSGEVKSRPFSGQARRQAGYLLRFVQDGEMLSMPWSRPMPQIGAGCHELRIVDSEKRVTWRIIYRIDANAVVVADVFAKKSRQTPDSVINACKRRFRSYDDPKG